MPDCTTADPCVMALDGPSLAAIVVGLALQVMLLTALLLTKLRAR